ncbi:uncharacterized protein [Oryza sativa Japonica Group]|uniref:uncharacterized protein isoform X2 n=1 Tax=Oryza sativa subsp. japonica TaxID=39947 RepID=UPI00077554A2|nr:uncharacterized protein LOC4349625 isoform X2 [Oryza sativa Japonica Group]
MPSRRCAVVRAAHTNPWRHRVSRCSGRPATRSAPSILWRRRRPRSPCPWSVEKGEEVVLVHASMRPHPNRGRCRPNQSRAPIQSCCEVRQQGTHIRFAPLLNLIYSVELEDPSGLGLDWIDFFFCWFSFCKLQERLSPHYSQIDQGVDKNVTDNSLVSNCDFPVVKKLEKCVDEEVSVQSPFENKDTRSLGMVYDHENNKSGVAEVIRPDKEAIESSSSMNVADEDPLYGCQTPRESIFDPFAPGPEELACAPKKNMIKAPELPPRRQLSFDSGDYPIKRLSFEFDDAEEDDQFLERICKMFIDLIVSNQALETIGKDLIGSNSPGSCETPSSEPLLTGIADTCPDAPLRRPLKAVQLSPSICRKLDFDSVSPRCLFVKENK